MMSRNTALVYTFTNLNMSFKLTDSAVNFLLLGAKSFPSKPVVDSSSVSSSLCDPRLNSGFTFGRYP